MLDCIKWLFNWKKYPENVFYLTIPLVAMYLMFTTTFVILMAMEGKWGFLFIFIGGMTLGTLAIYPAVKQIMELKKSE